jgi:maleylpyruvate isomerase
MLTAAEQAARAALRARQGAGARYDAPNAPHDDLLMARRGNAFFARKLNELSDEALFVPSLRDGWSRAHLVAHVSYTARRFALLVEAARSGTRPAVSGGAGFEAEVARGATLPARALRSLYHHATVHLDVEWRDLSDAGWDAEVALPDGGLVAARALPRLRAALLWQAAVALGNGARQTDLPEPLRELGSQL